MDSGFIEDTDSLNWVPIQAAGSSALFQVTKLVGAPEPDSRHMNFPAFDERLELLEMHRHDIQACPVAGPAFEPFEEAHGNPVRRPHESDRNYAHTGKRRQHAPPEWPEKDGSPVLESGNLAGIQQGPDQRTTKSHVLLGHLLRPVIPAAFSCQESGHRLLGFR
jgi:hypothetical protein